jgi:hypothetical protein
MIVVRSRGPTKRTERIIPIRGNVPSGFELTATKYDAGSVYLETDKGERRAFGSYYTPDHIVNHIVDASLGQVCRDIEQSIRREINSLEQELPNADSRRKGEIQERIEEIAGSFADRVLKLRVLDPAMGSGHFLIRACQYLAEEIATNPFTHDPEIEGAPHGEASLVLWKRRVAENCLYGVDVNPMAVELAKLAIWLETVAVDSPLAFLDHHLQPGDSLIGARIDRLDSLPGKALVSGFFKEELAQALPTLLEPLSEIRGLSSSSLADVKRKEQLFKRRFQAAQQRFHNVADVWCAAAVGALSDEASPTDYAGVIQTLSARRRNGSQPAHSLVEEARQKLKMLGIPCLHWELAFPEVFLAQGERHGFDVVLGNPPYDVLAEKEAGIRVRYLKTFIGRDLHLAPSRVGKNNLYKLFICRALEVARDGGYISLIVPMPLLGDEQARGVRQALLQSGNFFQVHAFPQKDNPARRVFRDAKLSTALFAFRKGPTTEETVAFRSVRHPANTIESASPSLLLLKSEIPLYDPDNRAIVSCSQDDWDLAVRIFQRPSVRRLGNVCKSFQGEVNETTDSRFLSSQAKDGKSLVLRGANVCMYVLREASQGTEMYLDISTYQRAKADSEKPFHSKKDRIGFQRSAPQNNYRRVIAAQIPAGEFCFDTISYVPRGAATRIDLDLLLALLNSRLIDWYFSIGSTNSKVNEYQFNNLPCPFFRPEMTSNEPSPQTDEVYGRLPNILVDSA